MKDSKVKKFIPIGALVIVMAMILGGIIVPKLQGRETVYETNKYGETYGRQAYDSDEEPDLLAVTATNGKQGYIKQSDVDKYGGNVSSLEEALEYQKSITEVIKIPVYTKDGDMVIGYFELR